jgi:hypothetical protein
MDSRRGGGPVKTLGGFRKAHHTVPDAVNAATNAFLGKLCADDLAEEGEKFFQATKAALGYKRAQLTLEVASPTAVLTAKVTGAKPRTYFEVTDAASRAAPTVDFKK